MKQTFRTHLGLWYGATIGLGLSVGLWLPEVIRLWAVPLAHFYPTLIIGVLLIVAITALAGAISERLSHAGFSVLVWFIGALTIAVVISGLLYPVQTVSAWLVDQRFWGQPIYEPSSASRLRGGLAGFFVVLALSAYGLLQENRLSGLRAEIDDRFWMTGRGWFLLVLGLLPILGVGLIVDEIVLKPVYTTANSTDQAIRVVRSTQGDLLELGQADGINYSGLKGERDRLSGRYSLQIGQIEWGPINTVHIVIQFESGVWLFCHLRGDNLSHCNDASPPYLVGFPAFVRTGALPEDCTGCRFRSTAEQQAWIEARTAAYGEDIEITKQNQLGDVVLMQARASDGNAQISCFFKGITPIVLENCWDSEP
ncbi:MAG: hypothetical protein WBO46_14060 [Caldilineaceae bacterium]